MLRRRTLLLGSIVTAATALALAPSASAACAGESLTYTPANESAMTDSVTCLVNAERTARGLPAFNRDARLDVAARGHSADMADNNYFDHDSQDGTKFSKRITDAGYSWVSAGENIAAGQRTAKAVMTSWMASTGHCQNILSGSYFDIGVGLAPGGSYGLYWTQDFARHGGSGAPSDAAAGCPFKSLVTGGGETAPDTGAACAPGTLKLSSARRASGGRLRIAGRVGPSECPAKVHFTIKRGSRSLKATRTIQAGKFAVRLPLPKARGNARVTARLGSDGPTVRRTVKL